MVGRLLAGFVLVFGAMALTGTDPVMAALVVAAVAFIVVTLRFCLEGNASVAWAFAPPSGRLPGLRWDEEAHAGDVDCPVVLTVIRR